MSVTTPPGAPCSTSDCLTSDNLLATVCPGLASYSLFADLSALMLRCFLGADASASACEPNGPLPESLKNFVPPGGATAGLSPGDPPVPSILPNPRPLGVDDSTFILNESFEPNSPPESVLCELCSLLLGFCASLSSGSPR